MANLFTLLMLRFCIDLEVDKGRERRTSNNPHLHPDLELPKEGGKYLEMKHVKKQPLLNQKIHLL